MTLSEIDEGILAARELLEMLEQARYLLQIGRPLPKERLIGRWRDKYALDTEFDT